METFFTAQAGAAAALTGLVFVALSTNLREIVDSAPPRGCAARSADSELRPRGGHIRVLFAFGPVRVTILLLGGDKRDRWTAWYEQATRSGRVVGRASG
jgi:hypothetical protein